MITVNRATGGDIDELVSLGAQLFREDAAVHDSYIDLTWSERDGRADFEQLLASPSSLVLAARDGDGALVGHLVGYTHASSPTRRPVTFAELRSMYVTAEHRGRGVGREMVQEFLSWAREQGCVKANVSAYVANERAQAFYGDLGFAPLSMSRVFTL